MQHGLIGMCALSSRLMRKVMFSDFPIVFCNEWLVARWAKAIASVTVFNFIYVNKFASRTWTVKCVS